MMEIKWKKTSNELPKAYENVLALVNGFYYAVAFYCPESGLDVDPIKNAHWEVAVSVSGYITPVLSPWPEYWAYIPEPPDD